MREYTVRDVILSTKDKLEELDIKLNRLRELTSTQFDKKVADVRYAINYMGKNNKPDLHCIVTKKDNYIMSTIKKLKIYNNLKSYGTDEIGIVVRDNNGDSYILNQNYYVYVPAGYQDEFGKVEDEILNDDFTLNFLKDYYFFSSEHPSDNLYISPSLINVRSTDIRNDCVTKLELYPALHQAKLETIKGYELSSDLLEKMINMPLHERYFDDYKIKKIESSPARNKKIIIPTFNTENCGILFDVEESDKEIHLVKKKYI